MLFDKYLLNLEIEIGNLKSDKNRIRISIK